MRHSNFKYAALQLSVRQKKKSPFFYGVAEKQLLAPCLIEMQIWHITAYSPSLSCCNKWPLQSFSLSAPKEPRIAHPSATFLQPSGLLLCFLLHLILVCWLLPENTVVVLSSWLQLRLPRSDVLDSGSRVRTGRNGTVGEGRLATGGGEKLIRFQWTLCLRSAVISWKMMCQDFASLHSESSSKRLTRLRSDPMGRDENKVNFKELSNDIGLGCNDIKRR